MSSVMLSPSPLGLGCVSVGFAYSLKVCLTNVGTILERFKITMDIDAQIDTENKMKCIYKPQSLAPGMQMIIKVIFHAKENNHASFPITITRGSDKSIETHYITALVVPPDNFKKITRNLKFKNKDIYAEGVECIGAISLTQSSFIGEGAPSMYSENLISDDEFEDLQQIPFVRNVYYNPYTKHLVQDDILSKVTTGDGWTVEESQQKSKEIWSSRLLELETKGMVTERTVGQLLKERSVISTTSSIVEKLQQNGNL